MPTTVLCIGNTVMGDDGVGAAVARLLQERSDLDVSIVVRANAELALIGYFEGDSRVIVVDAIDAGTEPGSVFRFDPDEAGVTELRSNNIHGMGVGYIVTNARLSGHRPSVIIYGVQVGDVRPRPDQLTDEVAAVVPLVAEMIAHEVRTSSA